MIDKKDWPTLVSGLRSTLLNQSTARGEKEKISNPAVIAERQRIVSDDLAKWDRLKFNPNMPDEEFWQVAFSKPFYPKMLSATVEKYVSYMYSEHLWNWQALCGKGWDKGGVDYNAFMADKDCLQSAERLDIVIRAARLIQKFKELNGNPSIIKYLLLGSDGWDSVEALRRIHRRARNHIGFGPVTTFHLMMDLGLKVVKPDQFLNFVSVRLGLIDHFVSVNPLRGDRTEFPLSPEWSLSRIDGYAANENFLWAIQDVYRQLANETKVNMRLIDYIVVKLGQDADPGAGIVRTICDQKKPLCKLCEVKPICALGKRR
jgi:hypothetical protein